MLAENSYLEIVPVQSAARQFAHARGITYYLTRIVPNQNTRIAEMAIETEKKYRLGPKRVDEITQKLVELGASFVKEVFEVNYQHRGGEMDERGATLRLRKVCGLVTGP